MNTLQSAERADCTVVTMSKVSGLSYDDAHAWVAEHMQRKNKNNTLKEEIITISCDANTSQYIINCGSDQCNATANGNNIQRATAPGAKVGDSRIARQQPATRRLTDRR